MSRYSQSPNYIARKTLWLAFNWWNILFFVIAIPAALIFMNMKFPNDCTPLVALALWMVIPVTICIRRKKLDWWNVVFFFVLIPAIIPVLKILPNFVPALDKILTPIVDKILGEYLSNWLIVLALWAIVPISIIVVKIIIIRHKYIEFYDTCVVEKTGVFFKHSKKTVFPEVTAVKTYKNILGYGKVHVDVVGPWDIDFEKMARPEDLREYLVHHMLNTAAVENISNNPYIAATDGIF
ncbi:MAG: hypothetical protein IJY23_06120 [Clostridia bacterium]|nr:hypothetical protein [Clostridia bacterium]